MSRYIDADKLIKEINERITAAIEWGKNAETDDIKVRAEQAIATFCEASLTAKKISTADVRENVKGEWEEYRDWKHGSFKHRCSECGYHDNERDDLGTYNYCPHCGADMVR